MDEILHRVNNLLGTIEIQSEVAKTLATKEALEQALCHIVDSARQTQADLKRLSGQQAD
jgi:hypothetical protein